MTKGTDRGETQRPEEKIFGDFLEAIVAQPEGTVNNYINYPRGRLSRTLGRLRT